MDVGVGGCAARQANQDCSRRELVPSINQAPGPQFIAQNATRDLPREYRRIFGRKFGVSEAQLVPRLGLLGCVPSLLLVDTHGLLETPGLSQGVSKGKPCGPT